MNKDRGIVKWAPFSSLVGQKEMIDALVLEKQKIKKPILSLEQQMEIEEKLMEAFYEQIEVTLQIYKKGEIVAVTSSILEIDSTYKKIVLKNRLVLLFSQIINISL